MELYTSATVVWRIVIFATVSVVNYFFCALFKVDREKVSSANLKDPITLYNESRKLSLAPKRADAIQGNDKSVSSRYIV